MLNCRVFWESILPVVSAHAHNTEFSAKPSYLLDFMLELLCDSGNVHKLQTIGRFAKVRKLKIVYSSMQATVSTTTYQIKQLLYIDINYVVSCIYC